MTTLTLTRYVPGPLKAAWAVYTELEGWTYWANVGTAALEREGHETRNGVGAIRKITLVGPPVREEVTRFEPPHHFEYKVLSGVPTRNHHAAVTLEEEGTGTRLTWTVHFEPRVPGTGRAIRRVMRLVLESVLREFANRMADEAEHRAQCPYAHRYQKRQGLLASARSAVR